MRGIEDGLPRDLIPEWDLEKEAKRRVWQAFWKSALLVCGSEELVQRFDSLERAVLVSGVQNVKRHYTGQNDEYIANMRMAARLLLEGVDVYWNDPTSARDGHLDSKTCFGKMYIQPYPFHCIMVYDDAKDEAIIRDNKFSEFLFVNFSPLIMSKRLLRQKLRALSSRKVKINFPYSRQEHAEITESVEVRPYVDSEGKAHSDTETRTSKVEFTCFYTLGVIKVSSNFENRAMAAGFKVIMTYEDGCGDAISPHTKKAHRQTNRSVVLGDDHLGLTHETLESPQLQRIFAQTQTQWSDELTVLERENRRYRQQLIEKHNESNQVLSDGFWFSIYNDPYLSRSALERYLHKQEMSRLLKKLPSVDRPALDFLYKRMKFIHSHRAITFWFIFWEDIFARNNDMSCLQPYRDELDPLNPKSICYRVMKKEELEVWLRERKLRGQPLLSFRAIIQRRKSPFHDDMIKLVYEQIQRYTVETRRTLLLPAARPTGAKVMSS